MTGEEASCIYVFHASACLLIPAVKQTVGGWGARPPGCFYLLRQVLRPGCVFRYSLANLVLQIIKSGRIIHSFVLFYSFGVQLYVVEQGYVYIRLPTFGNCKKSPSKTDNIVVEN